jgi:putative transposase
MVDPTDQKLSIVRQCNLLDLNRSSYYYNAALETDYNLSLMKIIDQEYLKYPFYGSRQIKRHLARMGYYISRHRVRRLMRKMGIMAIYQKPKTTNRDISHKIYPYLLRGLNINKPNQVWCTDITYIPLKKGFLYLVAIKDWYSRKVLSWRLSNTMDASFCISALEEALDRYGIPEIFNTDQGSQFTSLDFTSLLKQNNIKISMDGKGCWVDNVFIERLWRSLKYECVYLQEFENSMQARNAISQWLDFYNYTRPHSVFDGRTPNEVYTGELQPDNLMLAA